jgi:GNAT superfamily N-acetyltransferase
MEPYRHRYFGQASSQAILWRHQKDPYKYLSVDHYEVFVPAPGSKYRDEKDVERLQDKHRPEEKDREIEEVNALATGNVVGYTLPLGMKPDHSKMGTKKKKSKRPKRWYDVHKESVEQNKKFSIVVNNDNGEKIASAVVVFHNGKAFLDQVIIWEKYRNKGIGKQLYKAANKESKKRFGVTLSRSDFVTPDAQRVWRSLHRSGLVDTENETWRMRDLDEEYLGQKGGVSYFQMGGSLPDKLYNRTADGKPTRETSPETPCRDALMVSFSRASKGFGPLLYDVALEVAGARGLVSDRNVVSGPAANIWHYYFHSRPDINKKPLDDYENPQTPEKEDDCLFNSSKDKNEKYGNPLNYVYYASGTPTLDKLRQAGKLIINGKLAEGTVPQGGPDDRPLHGPTYFYPTGRSLPDNLQDKGGRSTARKWNKDGSLIDVDKGIKRRIMMKWLQKGMKYLWKYFDKIVLGALKLLKNQQEKITEEEQSKNNQS